MNTGAILLAAGASRRFGSDKRQARLPNGKPVMQQTLEKALEVFDDVLVVLRPGDDALQESLGIDFPGVTCFQAADAALGMGHSLASATTQMDDRDGLFVFLADMPFAEVATLRTLKSSLAPGRLVLPTLNGQRGHPVGFAADYFDELKALCGDEGAKRIIQAHPAQVLEIAVADQGITRDLDTAVDLENL